MDERVRLRSRDLSVSPPRESTIIKDNLWQAVETCSHYSLKQEYIEITELASGKAYDRAAIAKLIKDLPNTIRRP